MKSRIKEWALNSVLGIVSGLITGVLFEAGYRYYRYVRTPQYFLQEIENPRSVPFYSHSIWEFDEDHLPPDLDIEAMAMSKEDDHPSPYGMSIYARAAAEALLGRCQPAVKACGRFN